MNAKFKYYFSSEFNELYMREFVFLCDHLLKDYDKGLAKEFGDCYLGLEELNHDSVAEMFAKYCVECYLPARKLVPHYLAVLFGELREAVMLAAPMNQRKGIDIDSLDDETIRCLKDKVQKLIFAHCDPEV